MISVRICTLELERLTYEKEQKNIYKIINIYNKFDAIFTLISQQNTLNQYSKIVRIITKIEKKSKKRRT
ncbi:MAG: hypothetical protein ACLRQZ_02700 [Clostridia bacterium]